MQPARSLMQKVRRGSFVSGVLAGDHLWLDLVEICQEAGLDYLIADMEHGCAPLERIADVCAMGRRSGFPVLIRPLRNDYATIRLCLDLGACGLLLASIESAAQLDEVRSAIRMPPRGRRRPGGRGNRWVARFSLDSWQSEVEEDLIVLPQIETRAAMKQLDEIARHEIVSAVAVGPYDLSAELGECGNMKSPVLEAALQVIKAAAQRAGKPAWMYGTDVDWLIGLGFHFVCLGEPSWILQDALAKQVQIGKRKCK